MEIRFTCDECGQHIETDSARAGESVACPNCGAALSVPSASTLADITFDCIHCGQSVVIDAEGAGLTVNCPACNGELTVPPPGTDAAKEKSGES